MAEGLPPFPAFDPSPDTGDVPTRWRKWLARFENLTTALNIDDPTRKKALLLHYLGEETYDIYDTLHVEAPQGDQTVFDMAKEALTAHFAPAANKEFEIYKFRQAKQGDTETITSFYTRLKQLASTCGFAVMDNEIKSEIIIGCTSAKLRKKGLQQENLTLQDILKEGRAMELSTTQNAEIEKQRVNWIKKTPEKSMHREPKHSFSKSPAVPKPSKPKSTCFCCGKDLWLHQGGKRACPAFGHRCTKCKRLHHFEDVCKSGSGSAPLKKPPRRQKRNRVHALCEEEDGYVYHIKHLKSAPGELPKFDIELEGTTTEFFADSCATVNMINVEDYKKLKNKPHLQKTNVKIYPYPTDGQQLKPLNVLGKFSTVLESGSRMVETDMYVAHGDSLLRWKTVLDLNLLKVVKKVTKTDPLEDLVEEYDDLFHGLGKLKDTQVHLHVDTKVTPVAQPYRRVPFHVRKDLEEQLKRDEELGVIEDASGPTPWVSPIVVVPKKNGRVRVCVDMRQPNKAIMRERHNAPTINEVIHDLNGATVFSKLDLNQGYNQLELDEDSRSITTFATHLGLKRFRRLNFGVCSASEVFQKAISTALSGVPGQCNISDDVLVYGKDDDDHLKNLRSTLQRLREKGLSLNKEKCEFGKQKIEFHGHIFSADGVSAHQKKIQAIREMAPPKDPAEVRSLLGMTNYFARFIRNYATITSPLRELTKKDVQWQWTEREKRALEELRESLCTDTMAYFDPEKETEIWVDASPTGLGGILTQKTEDGSRAVVAYGSRALTSVEQRYSQTEREALAVIWACEHYHIYIFGKPVMVYTDHKPLVHIFANPASRANPRIERWTLRLQPYEATVSYIKGKTNPADYLSRHPVKLSQSSQEELEAEEYVNYLVDRTIPKKLTKEEVLEETRNDVTLQAAITALHTNRWYFPKGDENTFRALERVKDELSVTQEGLVLKGTRVVIPEALQSRAVQLAHKGHQGLVKTKQLLREKVWFHGIDRMATEQVTKCLSCQVTTPVPKREPLQMSPLPEGPWRELSADFADTGTGEYLLIVYDDFSRFPVVETVTSTSARAVIPKLDRILSEYGVPEVIRTDNGPPFNGQEFATFAERMGFRHRKVTPLWPRANGEVERFVRSVKKAIKIAKIEQEPWKREMQRFLRSYRITPHTTTGVSPATTLFGRPIGTKFSEAESSREEKGVFHEMRLRDKKQKATMKEYADRKRYVKQDDIQVDDYVLVSEKSKIPYRENPYVVCERKGSMITAQAPSGEKVTRNSSLFKRVDTPPRVLDDTVDEDISVTPETSVTTKTQSVPQNTTPPDQSPVRRYPQRQRKPPERLDL